MEAIMPLLAPVSAEFPCGEDLDFSSELDAIAKARQFDDPSLQQGAWVSALKEADWPFVVRRCAELLAGRSKDLRLAVWLTEAHAQMGNLRGMADGLFLLAGLCEHFWDGLYPLPDETGQEARIGNLCWLAARAPQLLRAIPLTEGVESAYSLIDIETARARNLGLDEPDEAIEQARRASSRQFYETLLADAQHCLDAIGVLQNEVDDRLGADGPGFTLVRETMQALIHCVLPAARAAGVQLDSPSVLPALADEAAPAPQLGVGGSIANRAQALTELRLVADFFRRTEPHSPVAYLADKAASWGEQPLHLWLRGVVKDPAALAHLEELLGVHDSAPGARL